MSRRPHISRLSLISAFIERSHVASQSVFLFVVWFARQVFKGGEINTEIKVNGHKLETVTSFKYLGSVRTDGGSTPELFCRIAQATAALTRLKPIWIDKGISLSSKIRLMRSLVTSIFLYACESWNLTAELQRRIQAMEMRCYLKVLHILYKDHVTNEKSVPRSSRQLDHMKIS